MATKKPENKELIEFVSQTDLRKDTYKNLPNESAKEDYVNELIIKLEDAEVQNVIMQNKIALYNSRKFSKKSEKTKVCEGQMSLFSNSDVFNEIELVAVNENVDLEEVETITYTRRKRKNRNNLSEESLVEVRVIHRLEGADLLCPKCNNEMTDIGHTEVRTYHFIPARIELKCHEEHSYKCNDCSKKDTSVFKKAKRITSFPKLMVENEFISHVITEKFFKHVPLYRQEKIYNNMGLDVSRRNFSNWTIQAAHVLKPLYKLLYRNIIKSDICHMDETTLQVIKSEQEQSYMWGLASSKHDKPAYVYIYKPNRKHINAKDILKGFKGYVHSGGYDAYKNIDNAINVGCFAHARRKYVDLLKALKNTKDSGFYKLALKGKQYIDKLYSVEHHIRDQSLSIEETYNYRLLHSSVLLDEYEIWLNDNPYKQQTQLIITKAINYSINAITYLRNYLLDGRLEIDNNRCERMMKSFVIGRKNFLFCFSEGGADASALLYSITETAYANNLNVEGYLSYVFNQLPLIDISNEKELELLLPYSTSLPEELKIRSKQ